MSSINLVTLTKEVGSMLQPKKKQWNIKAVALRSFSVQEQRDESAAHLVHIELAPVRQR